VENHPEGVPSPRPHAAHAVAKVHSVVAPGALDRAAVDGEHGRIALMQWHDGRPRLHAGTLFRQDELAAVEVLTGLRQKYSDLQREDVLTVEVLMQAVVVLGTVLKQQWRRPVLTGLMAALDEGGVVIRKPGVHPHSLVPAIGQRGQVGVEGGPQRLHEGRQRIAKVAVFATTESVPRHDDLTAEALALAIQARPASVSSFGRTAQP